MNEYIENSVMLTNNGLKKIVEKATQEAKSINGYRIGQAFMNHLPDRLLNFLTGTHLDCYYDDEVYPMTLDFLAKMIDSYWKNVK